MAFLFIPGVTLLFISGVALMIVMVFLNRFTDVIAFLGILSSTILVNLGCALLLVYIVTFFFILGLTDLFRNFLTLLLRHSVNLGNLNSVAHLLIHGGGVRLLNSGTVLPWLIPTLLFVGGGADGYTTIAERY